MQGICHRDLKPENIWLENPKRIDNIKIVDWSNATEFDRQKPTLTQKVGTPYYIAPEVLKRSYNYKCDVWSIGVIAFILLSSQAPFTGNTEDEIL
jgi:calcium-dependent protein kinase